MAYISQTKFINAIKEYEINKTQKPHFNCVKFNLDSDFFKIEKIDNVIHFYENFNNINEYFDYYIIDDDYELFNSNIYNAQFHLSDKFIKYGKIDLYILNSYSCKVMTKNEYEQLPYDNTIKNKFDGKFIIIYDEIDNLDNFKCLNYLAGFDVQKCKNIGDYWCIENIRFIIRNM